MRVITAFCLTLLVGGSAYRVANNDATARWLDTSFFKRFAVK